MAEDAFDIKSAPEEFQRWVNQALEGLPGCKKVHDVMLYGEGQTEDDAVADHDQKLIQLLEFCREKGLRLNPEKVKLWQSQVAYVGHLLTYDGV